MPSKATSASGKILHNSFWYGLETLLETVVFFGTSIAVARYLGPEKLGYFSFVNFFVNVISSASNSGLSAATRKYMTEFVALEDFGTARAIYNLTAKYQFLGSIAVSAVGLAGVFLFGDAHYRLMSSLLILSIVPGVMSGVSSQANQAFEDMSRNAISAFGYIFSYSAVIGLTLYFKWDLVGIASAALVGRSVEALLRGIPLEFRLRQFPLGTVDAGLVVRIRRFCFQAIGIQLLTSVVWDRSEMVFLKYFSTLNQIAFYSVSFGLADKLLLLPRTFGGAAGTTLMVEATRDPSRVDGIVRNMCRYLLLVVFPVHLGAMAITSQAIRFTYGTKYIGAIPVLLVASFLAMPKAFQEISNVLLRAADAQKYIIKWLVITGIVNIALDFALIPHFGAVGAAWGNGLGQAFGIIALWFQARRCYTFSFPVGAALRLLAAGGVMAAIAYAIDRAIPGLPGLILSVLTAAPIYVLLVKLVHGLEPQDAIRLAPIGNRLPGPARKLFQTVINFIVPA